MFCDILSDGVLLSLLSLLTSFGFSWAYEPDETSSSTFFTQ